MALNTSKHVVREPDSALAVPLRPVASLASAVIEASQVMRMIDSPNAPSRPKPPPMMIRIGTHAFRRFDMLSWISNNREEPMTISKMRMMIGNLSAFLINIQKGRLRTHGKDSRHNRKNSAPLCEPRQYFEQEEEGDPYNPDNQVDALRV